MTNKELEKRIIVLETEVALLKKQFAEKEAKQNSLLTPRNLTPAEIEIEEEVYRLGREYRLSQKMNYDEDED